MFISDFSEGRSFKLKRVVVQTLRPASLYFAVLLVLVGATFWAALPRETWRMEEPNWSVLRVSTTLSMSGLTLTNTQHCRETQTFNGRGVFWGTSC